METKKVWESERKIYTKREDIQINLRKEEDLRAQACSELIRNEIDK